MKLGTYSPEDVNILVAGIVPITGLAAGSFVTISKNMQPFSAQRTSDGQVARLYNNDQTYTITITLHSAAESNDVLTKLSLLDQTLLKGIFPLLIKDVKGTSFFFSTSTWIEAEPDQEFSDQISTRIWTLRSSQAISNIGSNVEPAGLLDDLMNTVTAAAPIIGGILNV